MAVVCVGQSAYDIVIPYDGELSETGWNAGEALP